jgi:hypothetical protein
MAINISNNLFFFYLFFPMLVYIEALRPSVSDMYANDTMDHWSCPSIF